MTSKVQFIGNDIRIIALSERFVFIGDYHEAKDGRPAYVTDCYNIRQWGTTAGLGEIALKGPTENTVLDACGMMVLDNPGAVLFTFKCTFM
jgi:hypothetical protein